MQHVDVCLEVGVSICWETRCLYQVHPLAHIHTHEKVNDILTKVLQAVEVSGCPAGGGGGFITFRRPGLHPLMNAANQGH